MRLGQLNDLEKVYRDNRYALQTQILHTPEKIQFNEERIKSLQSDIQLRTEHENDFIQVGKNKYEERKDAGALLIRVVASGEYVGKTIGFIKGFAIVPQPKEGDRNYVKLIGAGSHKVEISDSDVGTISRLENSLSNLENNLKNSQEEKANLQHNLSAAKEQVNKPFEQAEEIERLREELASIDAELDLGKQEAPIVMDEDTSEKPVVEIIEEDDECEAEIA